jgi:hypothetical protein
MSRSLTGNDWLSELIEALEQLPLKRPSTTCMLVIDGGVRAFLLDALTGAVRQ